MIYSLIGVLVVALSSSAAAKLTLSSANTSKLKTIPLISPQTTPTDKCVPIFCSSWGFKYTNCPLPNGPARVTRFDLVHKYSRSPCTREHSYGIKSGSGWVDKGCRGQFNVCYEDFTTCPVVCKDGWVRYKGSCYLFSTMDRDRIDVARNFCNENGAHLVRIETADENTFVEDYIRQMDGRHFYIDLSDEDQDGNWVWKSNGEAAMFLDWDEGEPHGGEYCAAISTNSHDHGRWIDLPCNWKFASPLCEIDDDA